MENEALEILRAIQQDLSSIKTDMKKMDSKIDKNTIMLEEMQTKLETVVEVQQAHKEQNERHFNETMKNVNDRSALVETAVQRTSKDVKEIKENVEVLTEMTGKHEVEIKVLQRRPI